MVRPRREPSKGWPPNRESHRICDPITLDAVWYRQFSGQVDVPGGGKNSLLESPIALILMGDWCGPNRHRMKKKTGARSQRSRITRVEKREQEKFSQECLCLGTCLL